MTIPKPFIPIRPFIGLFIVFVVGLMIVQIGLYAQLYDCEKIRQKNQTCVVSTNPVDNDKLRISNHK